MKPENTRALPTGAGRKQVAGIEISNPDREVFPRAGISKLALAEHYARVGERMLGIAGHRPFSLVRCPRGLTGKCFYQKHAGSGFPRELRGVDIEERSGKTGRYLYTASAGGLVAAAQMGVIEFHVWGAKIDRLERPDRLVFDLDPDEGLAFDLVRDAALAVRKHLDFIGLRSTPVLTGGKGIHVCVPLRRTISWDTLKTFSKTLATLMSDAEPDRFTATSSKARRKGRLFIDWLRNERGATAIAPYSARARQGAPVATPVTWRELRQLDTSQAFALGDMPQRLKKACPYLRALKQPQTLGRSALTQLEKLARER